MLLTEHERRELSKHGLYVREKCDKCGAPIGYVSGRVKKDGKTEVHCAECYFGVDPHNNGLATLNRNKEEAMATKTAKRVRTVSHTKATIMDTATKVGSVFRPQSRCAMLYNLLKDGKWHATEELKKAHKGFARDIQKVRRAGAGTCHETQKAKLWDLERGDGELRIVFTTMGKDRIAKATEVKVKASSNEKPSRSKAEADDEQPTRSGKKSEVLAKLVRHTLKDGQWTKNKLVEYLHDEQDVDPKAAESVVQSEIDNGGVKKVGGLLELVV